VIIRPTHRCFDDAMEFCEARARENHPSVSTTLRLVHGIVLVPIDQPADGEIQPGDPSAHAWVEDGELVFDAGILADGRRVVFSATKASYYEHYRIQAATEYTMWEALKHNRASGHYGPWRAEYQALCRCRSTS
jgi:hypothetical protein